MPTLFKVSQPDKTQAADELSEAEMKTQQMRI